MSPAAADPLNFGPFQPGCPGADPGTRMNREQVAAMIQAGLPDARVDVQSEDDVHFSALVVSGEFEGLRLLQRHQLVYRTLGDKHGR